MSYNFTGSSREMFHIAISLKKSTIDYFAFWEHQYYLIELKGMHLNYDFYVVVGKQCRTENAYDGSPIQYLYINKLMFLYYFF